MLWQSARWNVDYQTARNVLGTKWHEFVEPGDLGSLLGFLRSPETKQALRYRVMEPGTGALHMITLVKIAYYGHWLCLCHVSQLTMGPAGSCLYYDPKEDDPETRR